MVLYVYSHHQPSPATTYPGFNTVRPGYTYLPIGTTLNVRHGDEYVHPYPGIKGEWVYGKDPNGVRCHHFRPDSRLYRWGVSRRLIVEKVRKALKNGNEKEDEALKCLLEHVARLQVDFDEDEEATVVGSPSSKSDRAWSSSNDSTLASTKSADAAAAFETDTDAKLLKKKYRSMTKQIVVGKVLRVITFGKHGKERRARHAAYVARMRA